MKEIETIKKALERNNKRNQPFRIIDSANIPVPAAPHNAQKPRSYVPSAKNAGVVSRPNGAGHNARR